jgi:hypothetical protein
MDINEIERNSKKKAHEKPLKYIKSCVPTILQYVHTNSHLTLLPVVDLQDAGSNLCTSI